MTVGSHVNAHAALNFIRCVINHQLVHRTYISNVADVGFGNYGDRK